MKHFLIFIFCISILSSCQQEILIEQETTTFMQPTYTDSVESTEFGIKVKINTFDLFDTSYSYLYQSCTYSDIGTRFINLAYEQPVQFESNWNSILPDSSLRLTIDFDNHGAVEHANENYIVGMYTMKAASQKAIMGEVTDPVYGNVEFINGNQFAYLYYSDTIVTSTRTIISANLTAQTFVDSINITFQFGCHAQNCLDVNRKFMQILKSVELENAVEQTK